MSFFDGIGRRTSSFLEDAGGIATLVAESGTFIGRLRIRSTETVSQAYLLGVQSLAIVAITSLFTGMVFSFESAVQAVQYGFGNLVGGVVAFTAARELGPMLTGVVVAGRAGAAIAAELGSMVVTEQIEALQALGLSPVRMLVVPRLVGLVLMLPVLTIIADIIQVLGGMYMAQQYAHIGYESFIVSARQALTFPDVLKGLIKSAIFAVVIVAIGAHRGLSTRGGAAGVGVSTTAAVVASIIIIFVLNFALSYVLFGA